MMPKLDIEMTPVELIDELRQARDLAEGYRKALAGSQSAARLETQFRQFHAILNGIQKTLEEVRRHEAATVVLVQGLERVVHDTAVQVAGIERRLTSKPKAPPKSKPKARPPEPTVKISNAPGWAARINRMRGA